MPKTKPLLVGHDHAAFLARARSRYRFSEAYEALSFEYRIIRQLLEERK